jgi:hypothetical protein
MKTLIPIILFTYSRPDTLISTLYSLKKNKVPLIYAFSDGPRTPDKKPAVAEVRKILHEITWCEVFICERETNLGLGRSILTGVTDVLQHHEAAIIIEDDQICVPGTYQYIAAALAYYRDDKRVMSVSGWNHPLITPNNITDQPYFDGRAECWVWGTWARAWNGIIENDAYTLMKRCEKEGMDIYHYGADLPEMARTELKSNIWAVRLIFWHMINRGLCLHPPWSMVENIGFGTDATNTHTESWLKNPPLKQCPPIPEMWPEPVEHPQSYLLWQNVCGRRSSWYEKILHPINRHRAKCRKYLLRIKDYFYVSKNR